MTVIQRAGKGSKKLKRSGRNKAGGKYIRYRSKHGGGSTKKIVGSKEHRNCGPLAYYLRLTKTKVNDQR